MRFFLISDNSDAMNGLRLAGIEGTVARSEADLRHALADAANQPDIAVLLVTEKIAETYTATLDSARAAGGPLLITVPSTGGGAAGKDRLTRYIREAIGILTERGVSPTARDVYAGRLADETGVSLPKITSGVRTYFVPNHPARTATTHNKQITMTPTAANGMARSTLRFRRFARLFAVKCGSFDSFKTE